jgi:hypothetical protein
MAVFEQMMGAVLEAPQVEAPPAPEIVAESEIPVVPELAAEPELTLEPEVAVEPEITFGPEVTSVAEVAAEPEITFGPEVAAVLEVEAVASEAPAERPLPAWAVEEAEVPVAYPPPGGDVEPSATGPEAHGIEDALLALGAGPAFSLATETAPDAARVEEDTTLEVHPVPEPPLEDLSGLLDTLEAEYAADEAAAAVVLEEEAPEQVEEEVPSSGPEPPATTATGDFAT